MLDRRTVARFLASAPVFAGSFLNTRASFARQVDATERDSLLRGMPPIVVETDPAFGQARALQVNVSAEAGAQDRLDRALLRLFSVMDANKETVKAGTFADQILGQELVTEIGDLQAYAAKLAEGSDEEVTIPVWHHPEEAIGAGLVSMGMFDPRKGAELAFVDQAGLFEIARNGSDIQIWGFTPWLTEDRKLRIGIYVEAAIVDRQFDGYTEQEFIDMGHTLSAYVALGYLALTYGNPDWNFGYTDRYLERFFVQNPRETPFPEVASLLSGKPEEGGGYWSPPAGKLVFHVDASTP